MEPVFLSAEVWHVCMQPTHDLRYADDGLRNSKISVSGRILEPPRLLILLLRLPPQTVKM